MALEIVLDTETTGIDHRKGHRLIEVGCIEIEDLLPTGRTYHRYIDPEREIEADAIRVHGITNEMVRGKPKMAEICDELLEFIGDRKIIAHNASFDRGFINMELERHSRPFPPDHQWIDTLEMARLKFLLWIFAMGRLDPIYFREKAVFMCDDFQNKPFVILGQ